jgi:ABC-type multidrug transport system ATPase subunit
VNAVVETAGLGKRYRRRWALADCSLAIPAGLVVGLVAVLQNWRHPVSSHQSV